MSNSKTGGSRPSLVVLRSVAHDRLSKQIAAGQELLKLPIGTFAEFNILKEKGLSWREFTKELLHRLFDNDAFAEEFSPSNKASYGTGEVEWTQRAKWYLDDLQRDIRKLESIRDRLELVSEILSATIGTQQSGTRRDFRKIFIVHGHDELAKESVARFLDKIGFEPIILHERPNAGRTIIEKFESFSDVAFAVVLLTPDDFGGPITARPEGQLRARQNVIFELGYFIGRLGRERVCALYKAGVELPSDFSGVLFIPMDNDTWQILLAREMRSVGLDVDLNRLVR